MRVQNFIKCLMRMFAEEDKGVVFYETVINIKWQKHTFIECVPLPWDEFEQVPAYFKVRPPHPFLSLPLSDGAKSEFKFKS